MEKPNQTLSLLHPLKFWYQQFSKGDSFEDSLHPVADITSVE
jgi:hypothetical protein